MKTNEELAKGRDQRLEAKFTQIFVRMRLLSLFEAGLIDRSRVQDRSYLAQRLVDDSLYDQAPSRMFIETEGTFLRAARLLGGRGDKQSAVVLLFTAIEHVTNFYVRLFAEMRKHDASATAEMISASHPLKISVILPSLGVDLPDTMKAKIVELRVIRNRIVHFDHLPFIVHPRDEKPGSYDRLRLVLRGIVLGRFYSLPKSLREHCEATYQEKHPHYRDMLTAARLLGAA